MAESTNTQCRVVRPAFDTTAAALLRDFVAALFARGHVRRHWLAMLFMCLVQNYALGQTVVNPNISQVYTGGLVSAIARQANGQVIIGGSFDHVNGVPRNNIARLNSDGSLDTTWNPDLTGGYVSTLLIDGSGNIYVGGYFQTVGGQQRNSLAKLSATGTGSADATWNPDADGGYSSIPGAVLAMALDPITGDLYVGGEFSDVGGQARNNIAKLSTSGTGAADAAWNPNAQSWVQALAVDAADNVYASGPFTQIGGLQRSHIAKISGSGSGIVDPTWNPDANSVSGLIRVEELALDPLTGDLYAAGYFSSIGGQSHFNIAKLSTTGAGAADANWNPDPVGEVTALRVDTAGNVYIGGVFLSVGGQAQHGLARLSGTGTGNPDPSWNPLGAYYNPNVLGGGFFVRSTPITALAFDASNNVFVGGTFASIGGQTKTGFAYLSSSGGGANPAWASAQVPGGVNVIARDGTGRTVIGGNFQFMGDGVTVRNNIARLNSDGTLDTGWDPEADLVVESVALDSSGNAYVGGLFDNIGGLARNHVAKILVAGSGSADATWNPNADGPINASALDEVGGQLYVGGAFANIGGQSRAGLAKLSIAGAGSTDATWNPSPSGGDYSPSFALTLDGNGSLYVGGNFTIIGGLSRKSLAKLSTGGTGAADATWNPSPTQPYGDEFTLVEALTLDTNNNIYVGGNFASIGGQTRNAVARLSVAGAGAADATWNPNADGDVTAFVLDGSGHVYAGGNFLGFDSPVFAIGGGVRNSVARLSTSGMGAADCYWIANANGPVAALALDASNDLYVGGNFSTIAATSKFGFAELSGASASGCQLAITDVNGGIDPSANVGFDVTVRALDNSGAPQSVATNTVVSLSVKTGTGTLGGTTSCQIAAAAYSCVIVGVTYSKAESGVVLTATSVSGDSLTSANSASLTIIAEPPPTQLAFTAINGGATLIAGTPFGASVQAQDASGIARNVTVNTSVGVWISSGTGYLLYNPGACTIAAGTNSCTLSGLTYTKAESGVVLTADTTYGSGTLAGNSQALTVIDPSSAAMLTVLSYGTGVTVTSSPSGIDCTGLNACAAAFPTGSTVTLSVAPNTTNWNGACNATGTATCALTLNHDATVALSKVQSAFESTIESDATQATTTIVGNTTQTVDQPETIILGRYQGSVVYNQTFDAAFADPSVQAGVVAAGQAVRLAALNPSLPIGAPVLVATGDTLVSSVVSFDDIVTIPPPTISATTYIGPVTVPVGNLGQCSQPPMTCDGPEQTITVCAGCQLLDTLVVLVSQTSRTLVTTDTYNVSSTYQVGDLAPGNDGGLKQLAVSSGTLSPVFDSGTMDYSDNVSINVASATVTAVLDDDTASFTINGLAAVSGSPSAPIGLNYGPNPVAIVVTAADGVTTQTYSVSIIRSDVIFANGFELP